MDPDKELARAKWLLAALAVFLISGFYAFDELRYGIWGRTVPAKITQTRRFEESGRRGGRREMVSVEYSFAGGTEGVLNERDALPADWPIAGDTIMVQNIPGTPDSSRVAGHRNMGSVYVFLGSLAVVAGFIFLLYREAKATERRPARRSR